jgi:hypothetical protein
VGIVGVTVAVTVSPTNELGGATATVLMSVRVSTHSALCWTAQSGGSGGGGGGEAAAACCPDATAISVVQSAASAIAQSHRRLLPTGVFLFVPTVGIPIIPSSVVLPLDASLGTARGLSGSQEERHELVRITDDQPLAGLDDLRFAGESAGGEGLGSKPQNE